MVKDLSKYCGRRVEMITPGDEKYWGRIVKITEGIKKICFDLNIRNSAEEYYFIKEFSANLRELGTIIPIYAKGKSRVRGTGKPNQLILSQKSLDEMIDFDNKTVLASTTFFSHSPKVELDLEGLPFNL